MHLAKPRVDIGLNTNVLEPMLAFPWIMFCRSGRG